MKKFMAMTMAMVMAAMTLTGCGGGGAAEGDVPVIGISQYGQHASLDNCREGFLLGLEEAGLVEGVDFEIDYQNAGFDDNIATQIAQNFSAERKGYVYRQSSREGRGSVRICILYGPVETGL